MGPVAARHAGSSLDSATWRQLAQRADEVTGILSNRAAGGGALLARHLRKAACIVERDASDAGPERRAWWTAVVERLLAGDLLAVRRLAAVARGAARRMEAQTRARGLAEWRQWLTSPADTAQQGPARPSRGAYRWVRGLAGWSRSPVGLSSQNDAVPGEGAVFEEDDRITDGAHPDHDRPCIWAAEGAAADEPLCDQADIEAEADRWARLWHEGAAYPCPFTGDVLPELAPYRRPLSVRLL